MLTRPAARATRWLASVLLIAFTFGAHAEESAGALTGTWKLTVQTSQGNGNPSLTLKQEGEQLTGTYAGALGEAPVTGSVKGSDFTLNFKVSGPMGELPVEYTGKVAGTSMEGKVKLGPGEGTFTGKKE